MGLSAAHDLLKAGHQVSLYEADTVVGGMSASFDFEGMHIERFYHFICTSDDPYFESLRELGIEDSLRWTATRMGYYHQGQHKDWGEPLALLRFSGVSLVARIRYGLLAFFSTKRRNWRKLDDVNAVAWLKGWVGDEAWQVFWAQLFELKFFHFTDNLSAAWIWARMRRMGTSRKNLFQERLGYLDGGSDTWLDAISSAIESLGGEIRLGSAVDEVLVEQGRARGVRCGEHRYVHDAVISTVPMPFVADMIPALRPDYAQAYRSIDNIAVVCVLVKLRRPFCKYFWMNISDETIRIPGVIEYSNLCPREEHVLYIPFYMPGDHDDYQQPNSWFLQRSREYLRKMKPDLEDLDIIAMSAGRYRYAQPICPPSFLQTLPPLSPGIDSLVVADTSYYYPEDRSISESIKLGHHLADSLEIQNPA